MEFVQYRFAIFMTVMSFLCSETAAYDVNRVWEQLQTLEDDIYFVRKDIKALFDKTNQLNMSAVQGCGQCISGNKTSRPPVMNHDGGQDMLKVSSNDVTVKYHSLIKAFVTEKIINRQLQDQLQDLRNNMTLMNTESEKQANKRDKELQDQLRDLRNNMILMNTESQRVANERDREIQGQLQDLRNNMTLANERNRQLQNRLLSVENIVSTYKKQANERDKEIQDQLRTMRESLEDTIADIYRDIRNNMTVLMTSISDRIDEHLVKADTTSLMPDITTVPINNINCTTVPESGVYTFYLELTMSPVTVYCDQDTDGGGWIVFMRRQDGSVNFYRSWLDYKLGFGSTDGEFWAGNEFLHKLTKERPVQLRIDMEDFNGNTAFAMYEEFEVGAEEDKYRLHVRGYSGTAGDSLIDTPSYGKHVGMQFSTFDSDNDKAGNSCAKKFKGGWWYYDCYAANLNGPYSYDKNIPEWKGIIWYPWTDKNEALKRVEMKIR